MRCLCWAALSLCLAVAPARADGSLVLGERVLLREGPPQRGYCSAAGSGSSAECDRVLTKVLSGYTYGRGHASGGVTDDASGVPRAIATLHVDLAAGALPGGELAVAAIDAVLGDRNTSRLRFTLFDGQSLFVCRDAQTAELAAPIVAMFSRDCRPTSVAAIDAGLLAMQWDFISDRLLAEWLHLGPAIELLQNGFGYAHLSRSIGLGVPFDVRSSSGAAERALGGTSLGFGLRLTAFYRSPQWETRFALRQRTALVGASGALRNNTLEGELRLLHNFFVSDSVVLQAGISLRGAFSQRPAEAFVLWSSAAQRYSAFAGVHLGWVHEAPDL